MAQWWGGLKFFTEEASGSLESGRGWGENYSPSGVELLLLGGFLVGTAIGLFGLLQGVAAFVLLLHPVQHESHQAHGEDEPHQASSNDT